MLPEAAAQVFAVALISGVREVETLVSGACWVTSCFLALYQPFYQSDSAGQLSLRR